jgi:hypothetical protein
MATIHGHDPWPQSMAEITGGEHWRRALAMTSQTKAGIRLAAFAGPLIGAFSGLGPGAATAAPADWKRSWPKTDFSKTNVKWSEIISGGPPKDGIPSIDKPAFVPAGKAAGLAPADPVLTVTDGRSARTYPLQILIWHEIVNDIFNGRPLAITYCPLCNSGIVFDRRVNGQTLEFGTTGKLRNSDLVMYDRQTESWWQQFTGEAITGKFTGTKLKAIAARLESFADFRKRFPDGEVLARPSARRPYGRNPYPGYDTSKLPFLYRGEMPKGIEPLARVVVVRRSGKKPLIVSMAHLRKYGKLVLDGVELAWKRGQASALDKNVIALGRDVGSVTAQARGADGKLADINYDVTFAFVAHAFHKNVYIIIKLYSAS